MSREIYRRTIAPHNSRVATDSGTPPDNIQAAILLARDNQEWIGLDKYLCISPELFGYKTRTSAPYNYATKVYSANSPQRELGDELITNAADREFSSDTGFWTKGSGWSISGGVASAVGASTYLQTTNPIFIPGKVYSITLDVLAVNGGGFTITSTWNAGSTYQATTIGRKTFQIVAGSNVLAIYALTGINPSIDNISIREVLNADLTQTTANSQPYLSKIAPSEPQSLLNTNGDSRYLSHSAISFAANEKWTVECMIKINYGASGVTLGIAGNSSDQTTIGIVTANNVFRFRNESGVDSFSSYNPKPMIGKNTYCAFVASGNGSIRLYINGVYIETISSTTNFSFNKIMQGRGGSLFGSMCELSVIPEALSADRISYRCALLKSIFPEIPTVRIAGLDVACRALDITVTPAGNSIANVTDNTAWGALTTGAWCNHSNDLAYGSTYNKLYNGYARTTLKNDLLSSAYGYHIATEAELTALMASGLALKEMGTGHWTTANGTNVTGMTLLGGASRNTDGTFATIKGSVMFWCGDSDKCLTLLDDGTISIDAKDLKTGAYILLVKN